MLSLCQKGYTKSGPLICKIEMLNAVFMVGIEQAKKALNDRLPIKIFIRI